MSSSSRDSGGLAAFRFSERWVANSNSKFILLELRDERDRRDRLERNGTRTADLDAANQSNFFGMAASGFVDTLRGAYSCGPLHTLKLSTCLGMSLPLWPAYDRLRRKTRRSFAKKLLPILVTALVGSTVFLPLTVLAIEVVREVHEIVDYGRSVEDSGIPVPVFVSRLPYGGPWLADWWNGHLAHAGWAKDFLHRSTHLRLANSDAALGLTRSIAPYCLAYVS